MASTIKIKRSGVLNKIPTTSDIATGELAINYKDQKLYSSNGTGVFQIGTSTGSSGLVSITTATVKNLTQNDVVVTNVDVIAANGYVTTQDATATYQTKVVERAALANTNLRINLINTNLTGTNTALRTLISARLQVANATTLFNTKASWTALTGTNTALRTLISDRLQVANAAATYQTKAIERAALANTNAYIAAQASRITLVNTNLTGTNTAIRALDAQKLSVANATSLLAAKATWTALTGTNTALRTLISDRYQVANVNTLLATKATWSGLTGTNTALRTLISDRLQVANAVATYQTKTVERAALANTNASIATQASRITLVNTNLLGTNTAIRALDAQKLSVANAVAIYQTKAVERAALANTNLRINLINTNLTGTNTAIRALDAAKLSVANATILLAAKSTWVALTGTNTAIRALDAQKLQVANATTLFATKASWAGLTGTNTALRLLISDRMQVANAVAIGATKASRAGHTGTNTALRTLISDRLQVANASATYLTKNNPVVTGTLTANGSTGTAGYYLRTSGTGVYWSPASSGVSGANGFSGILVGANVISADSTTDRLTLVAGSGITIAANPATDTITFTASGGGANATVTKVKVSDLNVNSFVVTSVSGAYTNPTNMVTFTTKTLDAIKGSDTVVTGVQTLAATNYLQVANAAATYLTKSNPVVTGTLTANGSTGTSGHYLRTSGTGVYWSPVAAGGVTSIVAGNGITISGATGAVTVSQDIYTGTTHNNTSYPIGTVIQCVMSAGPYILNSSVTPKVAVTATAVFRDDHPTSVTGTWRVRQGSSSGCGGQTILLQRVA